MPSTLSSLFPIHYPINCSSFPGKERAGGSEESVVLFQWKAVTGRHGTRRSRLFPKPTVSISSTLSNPAQSSFQPDTILENKGGGTLRNRQTKPDEGLVEILT
jgi:hypothetical protein